MGDHSYKSESVPKTIFCSDCGKNVAEKETGYHNKYYHKVVICELCGFQNIWTIIHTKENVPGNNF